MLSAMLFLLAHTSCKIISVFQWQNSSQLFWKGLISADIIGRTLEISTRQFVGLGQSRQMSSCSILSCGNMSVFTPCFNFRVLKWSNNVGFALTMYMEVRHKPTPPPPLPLYFQSGWFILSQKPLGQLLFRGCFSERFYVCFSILFFK